VPIDADITSCGYSVTRVHPATTADMSFARSGHDSEIIRLSKHNGSRPKDMRKRTRTTVTRAPDPGSFVLSQHFLERSLTATVASP
jgi:hypothetical protein